MKRYICIHGHFYQPPRENPWLEEVEVQDAAHPFHDWNERITAECYAPNSAARILDDRKFIKDIVNNYTQISFNFGPTLLSWMERHEPDVYLRVLEADRQSLDQFSGHGSAIAQAYNHMILPLANSRDKRTQIIWGIRDFEHRFRRKPEGLWLPETAVDLDSLELMAELGIRFTILSPHQAKRFRKKEEKEWTEVKNKAIEPSRPYICRLSEGREIALFFFDRAISHDIAFGDLLKSGETYARSLMKAMADDNEMPQLVHVASDGETYGHHHRFGDMALAYCLHEIRTKGLATLTNYGEFLERFPPGHEVEIMENTSWSCAHGIERWRNDCGCRTGKHPTGSQAWRAPLRKAMDWLRDRLVTLYEREASPLLKDPWTARDDYIAVVLDRSKDNVEAFLAQAASRSISPEEKVRALKLLEIQRNAMLMYTSCGWFFDEISRLEPIQVMQYAARAMQLAEDLSGESLEKEYLRILERAPSNAAEFNNGAGVYREFVQPAVVDVIRVGIHHAFSSLFEAHPQTCHIGRYRIDREDYEDKESGRKRLAVGKAAVHSDVTWEAGSVVFAVLHLGGHNLIGGARGFTDEDAFRQMKKDIQASFLKGDIPAVIRLMDRHFGAHNYTLWHLFEDEKRRVLDNMLRETVEEVEASFRRVYEDQHSVMQVLSDNRIPLPKAFRTTVDFVLNDDFRRCLDRDKLDLDRLQRIAAEFRMWSFEPEAPSLGLAAKRRVDRLMEELFQKPDDRGLWDAAVRLFRVLKDLDLGLDLWRSQNIYFQICGKMRRELKEVDHLSDAESEELPRLIKSVGQHLRVRCR